MAKVIPQPIGSPLESFLSPQDYSAYRAAMAESAAPILTGREKVEDGWGQEYRDRLHKKGKLTAWERIERIFATRSGSREKQIPPSPSAPRFLVG